MKEKHGVIVDGVKSVFCGEGQGPRNMLEVGRGGVVAPKKATVAAGAPPGLTFRPPATPPPASAGTWCLLGPVIAPSPSWESPDSCGQRFGPPNFRYRDIKTVHTAPPPVYSSNQVLAAAATTKNRP